MTGWLETTENPIDLRVRIFWNNIPYPTLKRHRKLHHRDFACPGILFGILGELPAATIPSTP
ncbi:MAG: hypothetical protein COT06_02905 [Syntrophobacteraceae bacterium CG07_land_8_20_14_0_80_61_8]|nr:MAG: hypothetical protein COT06_02905 [Syntrophobacteraceae bacterium CG07_land_8_20_14_0_80_61_8]